MTRHGKPGRRSRAALATLAVSVALWLGLTAPGVSPAAGSAPAPTTSAPVTP